MKSFIVVVFLFACGAVVLCDDTAGNGDPVASTLQNLLDNLQKNLGTGDLTKLTEILKAGEARLKESIQKVNSDKIRENLTKVEADIAQLVQKLSSGKGSLDDVKAFINNAKDKFKQRLSDRIKEFTQEKKTN
ncbi:uncharacterized protein LOC129570726 [Sitodiplosis mosellana]|uniref:uncharacterized protein LOC129570726 n=1 Tax=Sitodiplosis mosellana TaxID=263140 RepID=UPI0024443E1A|nr:uncharacterized protein LOC129570726 [Sitodiplosis mosellana]